MRKIGFSIVSVVAMILVPAALAGGGSSVSGYGGEAGVIGTKVTSPTVHSTGSLPFTGMNLAIAGVAAILLIALGVGMRSMSRQ
jgi:hypothetical protein